MLLQPMLCCVCVCLQCRDIQCVVSVCFAQRSEATKEEEEPDVVLVKVEKMEDAEPVAGTQTGLSIQEGEWTESRLSHASNTLFIAHVHRHNRKSAFSSRKMFACALNPTD